MSTSPHLDWANMELLGLDADTIQRVSAQKENLRLSGAKELFTLKHLALETGIDWSYLRDVIRRQRNPYREIHIAKRDGNTRVIHAPEEPLKQAQRWILDNVLPTLGPRHPNSYAYDAAASTVDCAKRHIGARWLIKTDLHNFFPSVIEREVYKIFRSLQYSPLLSFEFARICTWPTRQKRLAKEMHPREVDPALPYRQITQGRLPQGAPTSGALANEAMRQTDTRLSSFAIRKGLVYTRYSDDMVFSGRGEFERVHSAQLHSEIRRIVTSGGFVLHNQKSQIVPPGARKVVLGVLVGETGVAVLPEQKRQLGLYLHAVTTYGFLEFVSHRGFESSVSFLNHVFGWLSYLSQIDPDWVEVQRARWQQVMLNNGIDLKMLLD